MSNTLSDNIIHYTDKTTHLVHYLEMRKTKVKNTMLERTT